MGTDPTALARWRGSACCDLSFTAALAPALRRRRAVSRADLEAARCRGVWPLLSTQKIVSILSLCVRIGVGRGALLFSETSAPLPIAHCTTSSPPGRSPREAAMWRMLQPMLSTASMSNFLPCADESLLRRSTLPVVPANMAAQ